MPLVKDQRSFYEIRSLAICIKKRHLIGLTLIWEGVILPNLPNFMLNQCLYIVDSEGIVSI